MTSAASSSLCSAMMTSIEAEPISSSLYCESLAGVTKVPWPTRLVIPPLIRHFLLAYQSSSSSSSVSSSETSISDSSSSSWAQAVVDEPARINKSAASCAKSLFCIFVPSLRVRARRGLREVVSKVESGAPHVFERWREPKRAIHALTWIEIERGVTISTPYSLMQAPYPVFGFLGLGAIGRIKWSDPVAVVVGFGGCARINTLLPGSTRAHI